MSAQTIYEQIMANHANMNPYLSNQGQAPGYFKDRVNEAFLHNMPAIQNAAALESRAYSLPGELMEGYDADYGGKAGVGSMSRMNSILKNIGTQFGTSNAAWNMVDQAKIRQEELAAQMNNRYNLELGALKDKNSMLMPLWQQMYADEQAMARIRASRAGNNKDKYTADTFHADEIGGNNYNKPSLEDELLLRENNAKWNEGANAARKTNNIDHDYPRPLGTPAPGSETVYPTSTTPSLGSWFKSLTRRY